MKVFYRENLKNKREEEKRGREVFRYFILLDRKTTYICTKEEEGDMYVS